MYSFYYDQLAAHEDGSGADYPSSVGMSSSITPTPDSSADNNVPADFAAYVDENGYYEETAYNPYTVGLSSPPSSYGGEHAPPSYTPTPISSGMAAPATSIRSQATTPTPTYPGPVPPTFGPGPMSSYAAALSQAQAQRRHSIATYYYNQPTHHHNGFSAASPTYSGTVYSDAYAGAGYSASQMPMYYAHQTQPYSSGVPVVPSNAPPANIPTPVVPSNAISHDLSHTFDGGAAIEPLANAYPQQEYHFP